MTQAEYEQKKRQCWEEAVLHGVLEVDKNLLFDHAFRCGYALSNQWVSTKERMPEPRSLVLVYVEGHPVTLAIWNEHFNCWHDESDEELLYCVKEVKFWMPIPQLPQKEQSI